jgi:predicted phage terminase large subunit-like protein
MTTAVLSVRDLLEVKRMARRIKQQRAEMGWQAWLERYFASYTFAPFADRHVRFWEWITSLEPGVRPRPRVEIWPRGGAKSSTIELACAYLGSQANPVRHYVLYVSETQAQANKHVASIASMLERVGVRRAVNEYGSSKGWRHEEIRTANNFNITAFGLDSGMRGVKLDEYRPDIIIFDDIDGRHDTPATTQKKIDVITTTVLPAGSADVATVIVQNKIHSNSIVSQLADGRADFLHDRIPATVEPAVHDLAYTLETREDGTHRYRIIGGTATWEGQPLHPTCEDQLNEWGVGAFMREAQHQVDVVDDGILKRYWFETYKVRPYDAVVVQSWDTAFKDGKNNDYSVCATIAYTMTGRYLLDVYRDKLQYPDLKRMVPQLYGNYRPEAVLIEDKASGQSLLQDLRRETDLPVIAIDVPNTKDWKITRVNELAPMIEARRVFIPEAAPWLEDALRELTRFPAADEHDDIVDAIAQGLRWIESRTTQATSTSWSWLPDDDDEDRRSAWR